MFTQVTEVDKKKGVIQRDTPYLFVEQMTLYQFQKRRDYLENYLPHTQVFIFKLAIGHPW